MSLSSHSFFSASTHSPVSTGPPQVYCAHTYTPHHTHTHHTHTPPHSHTHIVVAWQPKFQRPISLSTSGLGDCKVARMGRPATDYKHTYTHTPPNSHTHTHTHTLDSPGSREHCSLTFLNSVHLLSGPIVCHSSKLVHRESIASPCVPARKPLKCLYSVISKKQVATVLCVN